MGIYDAVCQTIASSGHRRGAQMAVLRIDHPDIERFITSKHNSDKLTGFNISVGVTDEFMECVKHNREFCLRSPKTNETLRKVNARELWQKILELHKLKQAN